MVIERFCGKDFPELYNVRMLQSLPSIHNSHTFRAGQPETWVGKHVLEYNLGNDEWLINFIYTGLRPTMDSSKAVSNTCFRMSCFVRGRLITHYINLWSAT